MSKQPTLSYNSIAVPEGMIKFSPSSIAMYLNNSYGWYKETILGEKNFTGNTATVRGTLIHYHAECFLTNNEPNSKDIEEYLKGYATNADVDIDEILRTYPEMRDVLLADLATLDKSKCQCEFEMSYNHTPILCVAGTSDLMYNKERVIDYKSCTTKPSKMSEAHKLQVLIYAYMYYKVTGITLKELEIKYIQTATKTLPARVHSFVEPITDNDFGMVATLLFNCSKAIELVQKDKSLVNVVFRENPTTYYGNSE